MNALRLGFFFARQAPPQGVPTVLLAKATKPRDRSGSRGPLSLLAVLMLAASGCATIADVDTEERERRAADNSIILISNKNNETIQSDITTLHERMKALEDSVLGEWDWPGCEKYSKKMQEKFCNRVPRATKYWPSTAPPAKEDL